MACAAHAQTGSENPDWKEVEAPPPTALKLDGLIPLDIPGSTLRFGVAPASITIGSDGIVRYVVVASNKTGAVNAIYEGIRCDTGQYKVYARHNPDSGWKPTKGADWRSLHEQQEQPLSRHTLVIASSANPRLTHPSQLKAQDRTAAQVYLFDYPRASLQSLCRLTAGYKRDAQIVDRCVRREPAERTRAGQHFHVTSRYSASQERYGGAASWLRSTSRT